MRSSHVTTLVPQFCLMVNRHSTNLPPRFTSPRLNITFNARPFKCFDLFADQTPAEIAVVDCLGDDEFWELVALRNLLAYFELRESSQGRE